MGPAFEGRMGHVPSVAESPPLDDRELHTCEDLAQQDSDSTRPVSKPHIPNMGPPPESLNSNQINVSTLGPPTGSEGGAKEGETVTDRLTWRRRPNPRITEVYMASMADNTVALVAERVVVT